MEERKTEGLLRTIEEHRLAYGTPDEVFEGARAAMGWKRGKQVEAAAFQAACDAFLKAPADGRTVEKEAKG